MDISIISNLGIVAIFLPLFYALYLFSARLSLSFVNKKVLNWGCCFFNLLSFIFFCLVDYFSLDKTKIAEFDFNFFSIDKFSLDLGFLINEANIGYLIFTSFLCLIFSLYSKIYFDKKKQFIFTKQRFYIFLSFVSFLTYFFIASANLFQGVIALILQSVVVLVFAYFDIFKNPTNHNITRFHRISMIGNFALLIAVLTLFKYAILSQGYVESNSLTYDEFDILISYMFGISSSFEFKIMTACFILAIMSRLMIFPLSCYYSFFANSSSIMYLTSATIVNNVAGIFLLVKTMPLLEMAKNYIFAFEIFIGIGILISLIQILFERNIKIIFGYLLSAINTAYVILFLNLDVSLFQNSYFVFNLIFVILLIFIFLKDKTNFTKRLINKQVGFVLEKAHIIFFEAIPERTSRIVDLIDEKLLQNISMFLVKTVNYLISLFVLRVTKTQGITSVKNILIIFAVFALLAIFIALFGGFKC